MNKYKEAFDELKEVLYLPDKYLEKRLNILQELVEKATPKKPIGKHTQYKCPVCGRRVRSGKGSSSHIRDNVCQRCYQVLDWGDEE